MLVGFGLLFHVIIHEKHSNRLVMLPMLDDGGLINVTRRILHRKAGSTGPTDDTVLCFLTHPSNSTQHTPICHGWPARGRCQRHTAQPCVSHVKPSRRALRGFILDVRPSPSWRPQLVALTAQRQGVKARPVGELYDWHEKRKDRTTQSRPFPFSCSTRCPSSTP